MSVLVLASSFVSLPVLKHGIADFVLALEVLKLPGRPAAPAKGVPCLNGTAETDRQTNR